MKSENVNEIDNDDDLILSSMGYKPELKRGLGSFMNFAFGFTEVSVISCISAVFSYGLSTGGPVVIIWGWVSCFIFTMCVAFSMAEICAAYPTAGSVYHWAGMIVPEKYRAVAAYITGWLNFLGNAAGDATFAASWTSFLSASMVACGGNELKIGAQVGISIAITCFWTLLNCVDISSVGFINNLAAIVQVSTVVIIFIGLFAKAGPNHLNTGDFVFTYYYNSTGWSSPSYVASIGLLTALFSFSGYEASAHMAEETHGSRTAAPYGIIFTCFATGIVGFCYLVVLLFVMPPIDVVLNGATGVAVVDIFLSVGGPTFGAALSWLIFINLFFAGISSCTVTGRITYALMRDGAFPYSDYWAQVNETTKAPVRSLIFVLIFDALLLLLPLVSEVAFASIVGISTIGFYVSYGIPILLKLIFARGDAFPATEMSLGPIFSTLCGMFSCLWLFGTALLLFLPPEAPVTTESMNWTVVVVIGFSLIAVIYWNVYASKHFKGPMKKEGDLQIAGRGGHEVTTRNPIGNASSMLYSKTAYEYIR